MSREGPTGSASAPAPASGAAGNGPTEHAERTTNPMEQFVLMVCFVVGMLILVDPTAREFTGDLVGVVLEPLIGFDRQVPAVTILFASLVMVICTTAVRHYFTDYLQLARNQHIMRAFNKEMRDARKENNLYKLKKLGEKNQDIMKLQADQLPQQLKPMAITMVVVVPIFAWLLHFLDPSATGVFTGGGENNPICEAVASVPWEGRWCLDVPIQWSPLSFLPRWVALYSLFSIPFGQVLSRALRARDLQGELEEEHAEGKEHAHHSAAKQG